MKRTIIWDWNGTLLDDVAAAVAALNRLLMKRGAKAISVEHYRRRFGFPVRPFYAELGVDLERWDWDEICEDFHRFVLEEPQQVRAEASTALMLAQERGWRQCILSALRQDKLASAVLLMPGIPTLIVALVKLLDRYGLMPGSFLDSLPFHTSLFITNNASIGLHQVNHHIYNFGSTSLFFGMGTVEKKAVVEKGQARMKRFLPIGITADERVSSGAHFARFFTTINRCLNDPSVLETPPESVKYDPKAEYHVPKVR